MLELRNNTYLRLMALIASYQGMYEYCMVVLLVFLYWHVFDFNTNKNSTCYYHTHIATPSDTTDAEGLNNGKNKSWVRSLLPVAGGAVAAGTVAVVAAPIVLPALGFGAGGIVAGSVAAAWQASIGNVVAGTLFASLQSAGVAGLATTTYAGIAATGSAGGAAVGYVVARKRD